MHKNRGWSTEISTSGLKLKINGLNKNHSHSSHGQNGHGVSEVLNTILWEVS